MSESRAMGTQSLNQIDRFSHLFLFQGLRSIFWILTYPKAIEQYLQMIEAGLQIDFCLAELTPQQRRNPNIRIFLLQLWTAAALITTSVVAGVTYVLNRPADEIIYALVFSFFFVMVTQFVLGLLGSVTISTIYGMALGIGMGVLPVTNSENAYFPLMIAAGLAAGTLLSFITKRPNTSKTEIIQTVLTFLGIVIFLIGLVEVLIFNRFSKITDIIILDQQVSLPVLFVGVITITLITYISAIFTVWLRLGRQPVAQKYSLLIAILGGFIFVVFIAVHKHQSFFYMAAGIGGGIMYGLLFSFGMALGNRTGRRGLATIIAALVAGLAWLPLAPFLLLRFQYSDFKLMVGFGLMVLCFTRIYWMPILFYVPVTIWNRLLYSIDKRKPAKSSMLLAWHAAFWYQHQWLPWFGLDDHFLMAAERDPEYANQMMHRIYQGAQRWAVKSAQIELSARKLEACENIEQIRSLNQDKSLHTFTESAALFLGQFAVISKDVSAALSYSSPSHAQKAMKKIRDHVDLIGRGLMTHPDRAALRFMPIAINWQNILDITISHLEGVSRHRGELENPFVCGMPLHEDQEIFVGRIDAMARIEQLILEEDRPALLLYGQRRMGKTSLLLNLGRILPLSVVPLFVDCQGLVGLSNFHDFFYSMTQQMRKSAEKRHLYLAPFLREGEGPINPFVQINIWLNDVEEQLEKNGQTALWMLDEFETLNLIFKHGQMPAENFFSILRSVIQHRPLFKVILSGSHTIDEFSAWSGFLINMQVLKLGYLEKTETSKLIEHPVQDFNLTFESQAVNSIVDLTRGHPHLVQQLCFELVMLKNAQPVHQRFLATKVDVEEAVPHALRSGRLFFSDLQKGQISTSAGKMLRLLAHRGPGAKIPKEEWRELFPDGFEQNLSNLLKRDLIEMIEDGFAFQIELIRQWFDGQSG